MLEEVLLDAIYAIATDDGAVADLLSLLNDRFGCISAALVYGSSYRPTAQLVIGHGVMAGTAQARYIADYAQLDPAPAAFAALPLGTAAATDRLFSAQERAASRFLREFYHPLGLFEALGAPIANGEGQFGLLAVHRGSGWVPFTDHEIDRFGEIASHVARAVGLRGKFFAVFNTANTRSVMLDRVNVGIMTVDAAGQLAEANAAARSILARGDGLTLTRTGRIRAVDRKADATLRAAFTGVSNKPMICVAPRVGEGRPYALKVSRGEAGPGLSNGEFLIQIADTQLPTTDIDRILVEGLGLSEQSARLTVALLHGETVRDFAVQAGIAESTAKFHLKAAFRATNTRRQAELVQLATTIVRDLSV